MGTNKKHRHFLEVPLTELVAGDVIHYDDRLLTVIGSGFESMFNKSNKFSAYGMYFVLYTFTQTIKLYERQLRYVKVKRVRLKKIH
jgi:hypothetical protein